MAPTTDLVDTRSTARGCEPLDELSHTAAAAGLRKASLRRVAASKRKAGLCTCKVHSAPYQGPPKQARCAQNIRAAEGAIASAGWMLAFQLRSP